MIVVIIILAILIGVTIGGIYMYVGQARFNTDIHNADSIQKILQPITIEQGIFDTYYDSDGEEYIGGYLFEFWWKDETSIEDFDWSSVRINISPSVKFLKDYLINMFPDGLPKS